MKTEPLHGKNNKEEKKGELMEKVSIFLIALMCALILFNQYMIYSVNSKLSGSRMAGFSFLGLGGSGDLSKVDVSGSKSTAESIALLFPVDKIKTVDDAMNVMIPSGVPEYGTDIGVSYDDPVSSLNTWYKKLYPSLVSDVRQNHPDVWQRYLNLASKPVGISCEYCCGVGPAGIDSKGNLLCGCSHNPAVQAVTLYLMENTNYNDAQVLREVMRWKTLWFPKNMVGLAYQIATQANGGSASDAAAKLGQLSSMQGGC